MIKEYIVKKSALNLRLLLENSVTGNAFVSNWNNECQCCLFVSSSSLVFWVFFLALVMRPLLDSSTTGNRAEGEREGTAAKGQRASIHGPPAHPTELNGGPLLLC